jgi:1,4-dihydroxy-2-naphthoate octaprenyltransferase
MLFSSFKLWIMAIRPKTLFASIGPVVLGLAIALKTVGNLHLVSSLLTLLSAICMQIGTNLVNDYFDGVRGTDTEERLGPKRVTALGLLPSKSVKRGYQLAFLLAFLSGIYLIAHSGVTILIIGILSLLMAYMYTGGPFPLSHYAMGEVLAFIFFGPIAVFGTYFIQTQDFSVVPIFIGFGPGLISSTIMSINNVRDIKCDQKARKKTLTVILGEKSSRLFTVGLVILGAIIPLIFSHYAQNPFIILTLFSTLAFFKTWKNILNEPIGKNFNNYLGMTGKYLFLYCLIFSITLNIK